MFMFRLPIGFTRLTAPWLTAGLVCIRLVAKSNAAEAFDLVQVERDRILAKANRYLDAEPQTVTANVCQRSAGTPHDFYSEGDYWWPDPE